MSPPSIIGIAGGTCSGKSHAAVLLSEAIGIDRCSIVPLDSYYITGQSRKIYDHPSSVDLALASLHLERLRRGESIQIPVFEHHIDNRPSSVRVIEPTDFVIIEGMFVLADSQLRKQLTYSVFVDEDEVTRATRRIIRDVTVYRRDMAAVLRYYADTVIPMYRQHVEPTKAFADAIVVSSPFVVERVKSFLACRQ